jgi:hypothetical protein
VTLGMIPGWFQTIEDRVAVKREAQIARAFLLKDLQDAESVVPSGDNKSFQVVLHSVNPKVVTYELGSAVEGKPWVDLNRTYDSNTMRVATLIQKMSCARPSSDPGGLDVCILFGKVSAVRRSIVTCRVPR